MSFVNEFGLLGIAKECKLAKDKPNFKKRKLEFIEDWDTEIGQMYSAIQLWDVLRNDERRHELDEMIQWRDGGSKQLADVRIMHFWKGKRGRESLTRFLSGADHSHILKHFDKNDKVGLARYRVQSMVNRKLAVHCFMRFVGDYPYDEPRLSSMPKNLLGCLWTQLALEVLGKRTFLQCVQCHRLYVDKLHRGVIKKTCSNACRIKLSRSK